MNSIRSPRAARPHGTARHLAILVAVLAAAVGLPGSPLRSTAAALACTPTTATSGSWTYVAFTGTTDCVWTPGAGVTQVDYLAVGGGASGSVPHGGGGGAGGVLTGSFTVASGDVAIAVGDGGAGRSRSVTGNSAGAAGESTTVTFQSACAASTTTITALGGGPASFGGGTNGYDGGSGGGTLAGSPTYRAGAGAPLQGNSGGTGYLPNPYSSGGGGGAGTAALNGSSSGGGAGGDGIEWLPGEFDATIAGDLGLGALVTSGSIFFAGGGGGGSTGGNGAAVFPGGLGGDGGGNGGAGGGTASTTDATGTDGVDGTGGGGGGGGLVDNGGPNGGYSVSGSGGSGIVILRYQTSDARIPVCVVPNARWIAEGSAVPGAGSYTYLFTDASSTRSPIAAMLLLTPPQCASAYDPTDVAGVTHPIYCIGGPDTTYLVDTSTTSTLTVGNPPGQIAGCGLLTIWETGDATEFVGKIPDAVSASDQTVVTVTQSTSGGGNTGQIFDTQFDTNPVSDGAYSLGYVGAGSSVNTVALWGTSTGISVSVAFSADIADPVIIGNYVGDPGAMDFGDADIVVLDGSTGVEASDHRVNLTSPTNAGDTGWAIQVRGLFGPGAPLEFTNFDRYSGGGGDDSSTSGLAIARSAPSCTPVTSTTDVLSASSVTDGDSVTATATVAAATGTQDPTGTVSWHYCYDASTTPASCDSSNWTFISSASLVDGTSADGTATASLSSWTPSAVGEYVVRATYGGDAAYLGSLSGTDALTVNDATPPTPAQITLGTATCAAVSAGTAPTLSTITYSQKGGKVSQVSSGVFLYWAEWTVESNGSVNQVAVSQTLPGFGWTRYLAQASGSQLYDASCRTVRGVTISTSGADTSIRTGVLRAGTYYLAVKYAATSVIGTVNPTSGKAYEFVSSLGAESTTIEFVAKR